MLTFSPVKETFVPPLTVIYISDCEPQGINDIICNSVLQLSVFDRHLSGLTGLIARRLRLLRSSLAALP